MVTVVGFAKIFCSLVKTLEDIIPGLDLGSPGHLELCYRLVHRFLIIRIVNQRLDVNHIFYDGDATVAAGECKIDLAADKPALPGKFLAGVCVN